LVDIFFLSRGDLRAIELAAPAPAEANDLILLLEAGPTGPSSSLLSNLIDENLIETTTQEDGVLTIELNKRIFEQIPVRDQREAVAQIVLTFLSNLRGVGQATFTIDDGPLTVPTGTGDGQFTDEPVSLDDYANMLVNSGPTNNEPPSGTTTTTAPEEASTTTGLPATEQ
jgi:spore germination protein GerM